MGVFQRLEKYRKMIKTKAIKFSSWNGGALQSTGCNS